MKAGQPLYRVFLARLEPDGRLCVATFSPDTAEGEGELRARIHSIIPNAPPAFRVEYPNGGQGRKEGHTP